MVINMKNDEYYKEYAEWLLKKHKIKNPIKSISIGYIKELIIETARDWNNKKEQRAR